MTGEKKKTTQGYRNRPKATANQRRTTSESTNKGGACRRGGERNPFTKIVPGAELGRFESGAMGGGRYGLQLGRGPKKGAKTEKNVGIPRK